MATKASPQQKPRVPKGEIGWTGYYTKDHVLKYILTSKNDRSVYFLYEVEGAECKRLGRGRSPAELEEKYVKL